MDFRNKTAFPALDFEGIDQHDQQFHVVALRQTLAWNAEGCLRYADEQAPLCEQDTYFGAMNESSLRQESDLCHYKPKCDVIVNATACPPQAGGARECHVRVVVRRPDAAAPLPERPQGLNQFVEPSEAVLSEWRAATARAREHVMPGKRMVDKSLIVTGPHELVRMIWPLRTLATILRVATLGLVNMCTWRMTRPQPFTSLPVRYEHAYGGQCRINEDHPRAKRIRKKYRLSDEVLAAHAQNDSPDAKPIAIAAFECNTVGTGFMQSWYANACGVSRIPAPQIAAPGVPFSLSKFKKFQRVKQHASSEAAAIVAGFGVCPKSHPARRVLAGTVDQVFINSDAVLPKDFDFGIWNAAPPDQQTGFLRGDEIIELTNLCAPQAPGSRSSADGNTVLTLTLPGHLCRLLLRMENGTMFYHPMHIDTVIVELEEKTLSLVWRAVFGKSEDIRAVDVYLHKGFEADIMKQLTDELNKTPLEDMRDPQALPREQLYG